MTDPSFSIMPETADDALTIERLHERTFGPGRYTKTAYRLRERNAHRLELSFTARIGTLLVGSVRLSPIRIGDTAALLLGPLTVEPPFRERGIGYALIKAGKTVLYRSIFDTVAELGAEAEHPLRHSKALRAYLRCDLLIIDDMGIKQLPPKSGEHLFEIVMRRYETRSTLMTSNRPIEEWGKLLGDVPAATAILDRFLHHAEVITLTGRSYRLKDRTNPDKQTKREKEKPSSAEPEDNS